jgi:hypothetical protein
VRSSRLAQALSCAQTSERPGEFFDVALEPGVLVGGHLRAHTGLSLVHCSTRPSRPRQLVKQSHSKPTANEIAVSSIQRLVYLVSVINAAEHLLSSRRERVYSCYWMHGSFT